MKHTFCASLGFVIVAFAAIFMLSHPTLTGAVTESWTSEKAYEETVHHSVLEYYSADALEFPLGSCGRGAQEWYDALAHSPLTMSSEIEPGKSEFIHFENVRGYGTINLDKSRLRISAKPHEESFKDPILLDFILEENDRLEIVGGRVKTHAYDCTFTRQEDLAICSC